MDVNGRCMAVDWPLITGYGRTMRTPTKPIRMVAEAFTTGGRTSLYLWLYEHIDELPAYRRRNVDWAKVTKTLDALGLRGRDPDKPLNENLVRKTYHRVLADRAAGGATPATPQPKSITLPPSEPLAETPASPRRRLELKPVTIKKQP
ncbi:MAG: hypothetical protein ACJ8AW_45015 [Rhodopila sp.]